MDYAMRLEESMARLNSTGMARDLPGKRNTQKSEAADFGALLKSELEKNGGITFSRHAGQRLAERKIGLNDRDLTRLGEAVKMAEEKGVRNTLVLMDRNAFIVNVPTGTVITAMSGGGGENNIFTQIDGAVIV